MIKIGKSNYNDWELGAVDQYVVKSKDIGTVQCVLLAIAGDNAYLLTQASSIRHKFYTIQVMNPSLFRFLKNDGFWDFNYFSWKNVL